MSKTLIIVLTIFMVVLGVIGYMGSTNTEANIQKMKSVANIVWNTQNGQDTPAQMNTSSNKLPQTIPIPASGGGGGTSSNLRLESAKIVNIAVCASEDMPCQQLNLSDRNVAIYWEVKNGIGCCHTFSCNYDAFTAFCGTPFTVFKLYDIALDGVFVDWNKDFSWDWNYTCSNEKVWNYYYFNNLSLGEHRVDIRQKDCRDVVDTAIVLFNITQNG